MAETSGNAGPERARLLRATTDAIRVLAMDAVQAAESGHPGMPLGMAEVAAVLWTRFLKFDPADPDWPDRDRFVLSAGHGSMLLYALLHLSGYDLPLEELRAFRQWGSRTPGHPERGHTPGVETTTGPLGQGISTAVGMALAERLLAARFNRPGFPVVDHRTWVVASDGDLMEGISHEACSLAGHLRLGRLVVLYDDNRISIDGPTSLSFSEDVLARFVSYGWRALRADGHDPASVEAAIESAIADESRPVLIACRTIIGHPSPSRAGTAKAHGEPLGADEVRKTKEALGLPTGEPFAVPPDGRTLLATAARSGAERHAAWRDLVRDYEGEHPDFGRELQRLSVRALPDGWDDDLPDFRDQTKPIATRSASGKALEKLVPRLPELVGGSADLTGSNKTLVAGMEPIRAGDGSGRYLHFGVREHGMGAVLNGLAAHGGVVPFGGTFLVFSDYMRPAIRLAALMQLGVIYVFTHDSIGLGEDGPTHQPIEHLAALRVIPGLAVVRPADATETAAAWRVAIQRRTAPTALVLTRQDLPVLQRGDGGYPPAALVARGAYVLRDTAGFRVILMASGSEVHVALEARDRLAGERIAARVVSVPSLELFETMPESYRREVLPPEMRARVAIEAGSRASWERLVGPEGVVIGLDRFGASAPYERLYRELGLTAEAVVAAAKRTLGR